MAISLLRFGLAIGRFDMFIGRFNVVTVWVVPSIDRLGPGTGCLGLVIGGLVRVLVF